MVPIGTPLACSGARVLDEMLVPCADGEIGELYLYGPSLARGYLGRPDLTAERFVADPFGEPGGRMYRTGDLGAWREGMLYHHGRADDQVKIRGFRVEPGEATAAIETIAGVREAYAFAVGAGDALSLVAAIAAEPGAPDDDLLRAILRDRLPDYLQPSRFLRLDRLPRTAVGKVDVPGLRAIAAATALPTCTTESVAVDGPDAGPAHVDDATPMAHRIRAAMSAVLGCDVWLDDSFFALGGHSLTALRLTSEVERATGNPVMLRALFQAPTPRALAAALDADARAIGGAGDAIAIVTTTPKGRPMDSRSGAPERESRAILTPSLRPGPAQERMLLLHDIVGGSTYTIALHWRVDVAGTAGTHSEIDTDVIERAWRILIDRHAILRTRYRRTDVGIVREEIDTAAVPISVVRAPETEPDRRAHTNRDTAVRRLLRSSAAEPFDLGREAPLRIVVVPPEDRTPAHHTSVHDTSTDRTSTDRTSTDRTSTDHTSTDHTSTNDTAAQGRDRFDIGVLVHHVATDEHGLEQLQREFVELLDTLRHGAEPHLPALPLTTGALADAQRSRHEQRADAELAAWRIALAGHAGSGELPADARGSDEGVGLTRSVVPGVTAAELARACERLRLTPFMLMHVATAVALQRAGAGDDLVFASPVMGRDVAGAEAMVDCATNTVPVRHRTIADGTIADLADRARGSVLDALEHSTISFDLLQRELGGGALSDVLVSAYHVGRASVEAGDIRCASQPIEAANSKAPLAPTLVVDEQHQAQRDDRHNAAHRDGASTTAAPAALGGAASVLMEYDRAAFTDDRAAGIARAIAVLIGELASRDPSTPVTALALVTPDERTRLLGDWGGEDHALALETFAAHFGRAARIHADRPAVTAEGRTLTYAQLERRARELARRIRMHGVRTEDVVAVATDRSIDMVVTHVATLLSAATFLAIDPSTPADRVATLFGQLPPTLVVTSGCELALPEGSGDVPVLRVDEPHLDRHQLHEAQRDGPLPDVPVDALAYVIFTSGTTGTPKPVGVSHRGVSKLIATQRARLGQAEGKKVLSFATPTFDASFWQLCGTLCDGGELVIMPDEFRMPGPGFIDFVRDERIDVVSVPPSVLGALSADSALPERVQLIVGAERLSESLVARWGRDHVLVNAYGPSEATVNTTLHRCVPDAPGAVPIGRIDPGMRGYVVDAAFTLCPVGFPGELVIGGEGVARGYLGDPVKTAAAFVADPFAPGERCYRSGDRVVWRADGALEFLGRVDDQVKLRGFRIEPGEITAAVETLPGVLQAAVTVRESAAGQPQLVAYLVAAGQAPSESAVRDRLRTRLPAYLVPDRVVAIAAIPRQPSGKLDRRALPAPPPLGAALGSSTDGDAGPDVSAMCRAFANAIGVPEVQPDDDYFALGGSSLTAADLLRGVVERTGRPLTFADLLAAPTPRALAAATPQQDPLGIRLDLRPAPTRDALAPVWLLPPLAGMSWCYTGLRRWIDPRRGLVGLQTPNLTGDTSVPDDFGRLVAIWAEIIERDRDARNLGAARGTTDEHWADEPVHLVGWSFGGASALGVAAELQHRGVPTGLVSMLDSYPVAEWATEAPSEAESLRSALGMLGVDVALDEAAGLDAEAAAARMATANPLLAGLRSFDPGRMIENFRAGPALERSAKFTGYTGDLLVFTAERTAAMMATDWRAWQQHVDGTVRAVPVDATHQEMVRDEAIAVVGPELDRVLRDLP